MNPALETLTLACGTPQRALFLGARPHPAFANWPEILGWQPLKPLADAWDRAGFARAGELPLGKWPLVLALPGKSRDETLSWFAIARDRLEKGGKMVVAMPNTAGAARFEKELAKAVGDIESIQKNKCRVFRAADDGTWHDETFDGWRILGEPRYIPNTSFLVESGIFSSDHIDPGSQLLADHLPAHLRGAAADLGAGWGFLSKILLDRCPGIERIDLYEADARALACARRNLAGPAEPRLESPPCYLTEEIKTRFRWHDVTAGLPEMYDVIVMNPPFHTGQATDIDLGRAFLTVAIGALRRSGKLYLVANRQLPYEAVLETSGLAWRKLAENHGYKVLTADKRR
jgi:16S rRNA (guanine1207-N2)-methyltransferase